MYLNWQTLNSSNKLNTTPRVLGAWPIYTWVQISYLIILIFGVFGFFLFKKIRKFENNLINAKIHSQSMVIRRYITGHVQ